LLKATMTELRNSYYSDNQTFETCSWSVTESTFRDYYRETFRSIMPDESIEELIKRKLIANNRCVALDLMSYGGALRKSRVTSGVSVAASDPRTTHERGTDQVKGLGLLVGDINLTSTWRSINEWAEINPSSRTGFDLIIARPYGGASQLSSDLAVNKLFLSRIYQLLRKDQGTALLQYQLPSQVTEDCFNEWVDKTNQSGIDVKVIFSQNSLANVIYLTRNNDSPDSISF